MLHPRHREDRILWSVDCGRTETYSREACDRQRLIEMRLCHDSINQERDGLEANRTAETSYYYE